MGAVRVGLLCGMAIAVGAPKALAETASSPNWAGYVAHRAHVRFSEVSAEWVQPSATCSPGQRTRSSIWVGLGGFSRGSKALEQIGTQVDCNPSGQAQMSAWYELVPALSTSVSYSLKPGDLIAARVSVNAQQVRMSLTDLNRGWTFVKQLRASRIDVSSADWIVESPSNCFVGPACHFFALANFGSVMFAAGRVVSSRGYAGGIADPRWRSTRVVLRRSAPASHVAKAGGNAVPGPLQTYGTGFTVSYGRLG